MVVKQGQVVNSGRPLGLSVTPALHECSVCVHVCLCVLCLWAVSVRVLWFQKRKPIGSFKQKRALWTRYWEFSECPGAESKERTLSSPPVPTQHSSECHPEHPTAFSALHTCLLTQDTGPTAIIIPPVGQVSGREIPQGKIEMEQTPTFSSFCCSMSARRPVRCICAPGELSDEQGSALLRKEWV